MSYSIRIKRSAAKDLQRLGSVDRQRLIDAIPDCDRLHIVGQSSMQSCFVPRLCQKGCRVPIVRLAPGKPERFPDAPRPRWSEKKAGIVAARGD